jgi:hypothetical protein
MVGVFVLISAEQTGSEGDHDLCGLPFFLAGDPAAKLFANTFTFCGT